MYDSSITPEIRVGKRRQRWLVQLARSLPGNSRKSITLDHRHRSNLLILIDKKGPEPFCSQTTCGHTRIKKVGAGNKPGSVIDNHSSGTAVADCL